VFDGKRVIAGPVEATAVGNILMQAMAFGEIGGLHEARQIVRNSFPCEEYEPASRGAWDEAYGRFLNILDKRAGSSIS